MAATTCTVTGRSPEQQYSHVARMTRYESTYVTDIGEIHMPDFAKQPNRIVQFARLNAEQRTVEILRHETDQAGLERSRRGSETEVCRDLIERRAAKNDWAELDFTLKKRATRED